MTLAEVTGIEQWLDSGSSDVGPVEASVQDVEAEIAVHHQVVLGGQIGREAKNVSALLPGRHGGVGTMHSNQITHVVVQIPVLEFLVQLGEPGPDLDSALGFLFAAQQIEKGYEGIRASRHHVAEQSVCVRTHAPARTQSGIHQRSVVLDDDVEFAQRAVDIAVDEKKVRRFPRDIGSGGLGLQRAIQRCSLARVVPGYLICGGQIEPVAGIVRVESDGGPKTLDGGLRIRGDKREVASQSMAIVRISWREAHRALQRWQLRTRSKQAGRELFAGKENVDTGKEGHTESELPTSPV